MADGWRLNSGGVSPIVAEMLLLGIVVGVISAATACILAQPITHERYLNLSAEVENTVDPEVVNVVVRHRGGEPIDSPTAYLTVWGGGTGAQGWENRAYDVVYSNPDKFAMGDNLTCSIRYGGADVRAGDTFRVRVQDDYSESSIFLSNLTVKIFFTYW